MDPRVRRTRARLHAALFEACADRPLSEVTVSQVVRHAKVARATFYLHYDDLAALAVGACSGLVHEAVDALHSEMTGEMDSARPHVAVTELLTSVERHATVYRSLIGPTGAGPLGESLHRGLRDRALEERRKRKAHPADEAVSNAVAATFTAVLAGWLHGDVPGTAEEVAAQVWALMVVLHGAL